MINKYQITDNNIISDTMNKIIEDLYKKQKLMPDLLIRKIKVNLFNYVYIICNEGLSSSKNINDFILRYLSSNNYKSLANIPSINSKEINEDEILFYVLNGFACVIENDNIFAFEMRSEIDRGVTEPTSEPTIRGSKDSFTENYQKNIGLIRKRIKTDKLKLEEITIGTDTKTKVGIFYIKDLSDYSLVTKVKNELNNVKSKNLIDSNNLRELLINEHSSIMPVLKSSELPNNAARYLLDGRIIICLENSPSILIIPSFFIDFFKNNEDYNVKPVFASFIRIVRLIAFFLAIYLPALYIALTNFDQEIIPNSLLVNFALQRVNVAFPSIIEMFILLFAFEILHEGDSKIPNSVGSSMSILGALVLGDAAVSAGLISPIIVIIVAACSICSLLFIYHDMQGVIRFYRYFFMILSCTFGIIGLLIGTLVFLIHICNLKTFDIPYLTPLVPLRKKELNDSIIRNNSFKEKRKPFMRSE